MRWIALVMAAALSACADRSLKPVCPTLITYPASEQKALAAELGREQGNPETMRWIEDYIGLRDQVQACQKGA